MADGAGARLPPNLLVGSVDGARVVGNLAHFVRMLRRVGFGAGPGAVAEAARAAALVGVGRRADFYWALHALLVEREDQRALFREAFRLFWRAVDPASADAPAPAADDPLRAPPERTRVSRRIGEAWDGPGVRRHAELSELSADRSGTASAAEALGARDFEGMSAAEWAQARALVGALLPALGTRKARRLEPSARGRADLRATVRLAMRTGGEVLGIGRRRRRELPRPVVVVCDISGSMSSYSRMFLHFMHGLNRLGSPVHRFVFGTRLTRVDRCLRHGDPDIAVGRAGRLVQDWSGGTRIGEALAGFNRDWARRTLGQGAVVLLATDGLERGGADALGLLGREAERLAKSCARLVWLNPLLRHGGYEALAGGARVLAAHADEVRSIHSVDSLAGLCASLSGARGSGQRPR